MNARAVAVGALALLAAERAAAQTTWTVTQANGVQAAIQAAAPGDAIVLPNTGGVIDYEPFVVWLVTVPDVPALQHVAVWVQAVSGVAWPLHASTLAGGPIR